MATTEPKKAPCDAAHDSPPTAEAPDVPDGGAQAWAFVAAAWLIELMVWGISFAYGAMQDYHENNPASPFYGSSVSAISSIGTLVVGSQHLIMILVYNPVRAFPHLLKPACYVGVVLSALCLLISSFVNHIALLILFQGLLFGITGGILFVPVITWIPTWFNKRRGLATGAFLSGSGIGGIIFPFIFNSLLESVGFRWTMRAWALMQLLLTGFAAYFIRPATPLPKPDRPTTLRDFVPPSITFLFRPRLMLYSAVIVLQAFPWYTLTIYLAPFVTAHGYSSTVSTAVLSTLNAAAACGYVTTGFLVDKASYAVTLTASMLLCGLVALLVLGFATTLAPFLVFAVLMGLSSGGFPCYFTPWSRSIHDLDFTLVFSALCVVRGIAAIVGPQIASAIYPDNAVPSNGGGAFGQGGFKGWIAFIGALFLAASAFALPQCYLNWKENKLERKRCTDQESNDSRASR